MRWQAHARAKDLERFRRCRPIGIVGTQDANAGLAFLRNPFVLKDLLHREAIARVEAIPSRVQLIDCVVGVLLEEHIGHPGGRSPIGPVPTFFQRRHRFWGDAFGPVDPETRRRRFRQSDGDGAMVPYPDGFADGFSPLGRKPSEKGRRLPTTRCLAPNGVSFGVSFGFFFFWASRH